jgi:hypothetical protein
MPSAEGATVYKASAIHPALVGFLGASMNHTKRALCSVPLLCIGILACALPAISTPAPADFGLLETAIVQTVIGAQTQSAVPGPSLAADALPSAFLSETPTATPTVTETATPFYTFTPPIPLISVSVATNCRSGPGKVYDYRGALLVGKTVEVFGRDPSGNYWFIRDPDGEGDFCWVWGKYATISGNVSNLPLHTPPPTPTASPTPLPSFTPTPAPAFKLSLASMDSCSGSWWVDLRVKNTGAVAFKSYDITIKDKGSDTTLTDLSDGFRDVDGCLSSSVVEAIEPGDTYLLSTPAFPHNLADHELRLVLTLCSGTGQKGICETVKLDFSP